MPKQKSRHGNKRRARIARTKRMAKVLEEIFPEVKTALSHSNPWELLVSVVLSAQCTDERVNTVTKDLFKKYRSIDDYARVRQSEFEKDIYSTGFYKNKAKHIRNAAQYVRDELGGELPDTLDALQKIPGVGRKTANVVLSNSFGIHEGIAVDTHVRRFAIRFNLSDFKDPERIEKDLMDILPKDEWFDFSNRLIYYGREYCPARKHDCSTHPLTTIYPKANHIWPKAH